MDIQSVLSTVSSNIVHTALVSTNSVFAFFSGAAEFFCLPLGCLPSIVYLSAYSALFSINFLCEKRFCMYVLHVIRYYRSLP